MKYISLYMKKKKKNIYIYIYIYIIKNILLEFISY